MDTGESGGAETVAQTSSSKSEEAGTAAVEESMDTVSSGATPGDNTGEDAQAKEGKMDTTDGAASSKTAAGSDSSKLTSPARRTRKQSRAKSESSEATSGSTTAGDVVKSGKGETQAQAEAMDTSESSSTALTTSSSGSMSVTTSSVITTPALASSLGASQSDPPTQREHGVASATIIAGKLHFAAFECWK